MQRRENKEAFTHSIKSNWGRQGKVSRQANFLFLFIFLIIWKRAWTKTSRCLRFFGTEASDPPVFLNRVITLLHNLSSKFNCHFIDLCSFRVSDFHFLFHYCQPLLIMHIIYIRFLLIKGISDGTWNYHRKIKPSILGHLRLIVLKCMNFRCCFFFLNIFPNCMKSEYVFFFTWDRI